MYLTKFRLHNYKSFLDSGTVSLKPGFNIITGQNNAGKTALLEALTLRFDEAPHRSLATAPTPLHPSKSGSMARVRFVIEKSELHDFLSKFSVSIPFAVGDSTSPDSARERFRFIKEQEQLDIEFNINPPQRLSFTQQPTFGLYQPMTSPPRVAISSPDQTYSVGLAGHFDQEEVGLMLTQHLVIPRIYGFKAERLNIGISPFGSNRDLQSDARNLPEALNTLQSNPARLARFNKFVTRVFPQVAQITVRPTGNQLEILVWSDAPEKEREDLAVPLSRSGTGIGQVLAMLYVLVTSEFPRVIIIDEPNSFLHPGAVRSLIEIFKEHPQHQYIVSTHSPDFINASDPSTIHMLRKRDGASISEEIDAGEARDLKTLLLEIGSRLSDVFGADGVLWVEGQTEEQCFPLIARDLSKRALGKTAIRGVLHTGDFDAEDSRMAFRIYERLTHGPALLPPAVAFIFDRELRPEKAREDLIRESKGKVSFLTRRTYENYLLHPKAIAEVLNKLPPFTEMPTSEQKVKNWLDEHSQDSKYYGKSKAPDSLKDVDAPKLLKDLFYELSGNRLEYRKTEHSVRITEWLIKHDPEALKEIADLLASALPPSPT